MRTRPSDRNRVKKVLKVFRPGKIYLNSGCGFGTFAERSYDYNPVILAKASVGTLIQNNSKQNVKR